MNFTKFYFTEKTLAARKTFDSQADQKCLDVGQQMADRFGLKFDGWWEFSYQFTIPAGLPDEKNTFLAKNEKEILEKLKKRFPNFLEYTMKKNFPNGYKTDSSFPLEPPTECEPIDLEKMAGEMA
jgi:hypothetical protein